MLVDVGGVERRYQAVLEVLQRASVVDVARRYGVARQTVHVWLRRYASDGLAGLVEKSSKPATCPHQMSGEIEARIVEMRRPHPGWVRGRSAITWNGRVCVRCLPVFDLSGFSPRQPGGSAEAEDAAV